MRWFHRMSVFACLAGAIGIGGLVSGCRKMVEKEKMEAAAAYSKEICACKEKSGAEAKACVEAIKAPEDPETLDYHRDSLRAYDEIIAIGTNCKMQVYAQ